MSYGAIEDVSRPSTSGLGAASTSQLSSPLLGRARRTSRASSVRTGPFLVASTSRPDEVTRLINDQYAHLPSSAALQETDLSVEPIGLDMADEEPDSFRRQTLLSLDLLRGVLLALLALENIQLFLRSEQESDENWYSKQERWTESPLYALRLLANPAAPGLFMLGGVGVVLYQQSRLQLGWSRWQLLRHFTIRGGALMITNMLLTYDFTVREDGPNLIENLILWTYGINLFLLGCTVIALHTFERYLIQRWHSQHKLSSDPFIDDTEESEDASARPETFAHYAGNAVLLLLSAGLLAVNMLGVPRRGTQPEDRSDWFWFWVMPMPTNMLDPSSYGKITSQYAPLNWLPFGFIGIIYARFLTRRSRSQLALSTLNLAIFALLFTFFILTRVLKFGNLSSHLLPAHPQHPKNSYLESWQAFLYTVKFPPDLAYSSLCVGVNALLFTACLAVKTAWKESLPLLRFGRTPVFFYAANLLVFRFLSTFALTFFGLPTKLDLGPAMFCYAGTLFILWFLCKGFLAFKEARSSPDSLWRFF